MDFYFTDRHFGLLEIISTTASTDLVLANEEDKLSIENGNRTLTGTLYFNQDQSAQVKKCATIGNYILYHDLNNKDVWMTIVEIEHNPLNGTHEFVAEDAGLDLLNELLGPFKADKAYPISYYISKFTFDSGFELGFNEIPSLTRKLEWEGESTTALARLVSVATQFDNAEIEFSFEVEGTAVLKKYVNIYKKRGKDNRQTLYVNVDVNNIIVKSDIYELATALYSEGGTLDGKNEPVNLKGYKWTDPEKRYVLDSATGILKDTENGAKWSRLLPGQANPNGAYILRRKSYETTDPKTLLDTTLRELKKVSEPVVNYEVDIAELPEGVNVGDTIYLVDENEEVYLSARVLELTYKYSIDSYAATLGDYLIQQGGVSQSLIDLANELREQVSRKKYDVKLEATTTTLANEASTAKIIAKVYDGALDVSTNFSKYKWTRMNSKGVIDPNWSNITNTVTAVSDSEPLWTYICEVSNLLDDGTSYLIGTDRITIANLANDSIGKPGKPGEDGKTSYFHTAYANDQNGKDFSTTDSTNKSWIGTYSDFEPLDSGDYRKYEWTKVKGDPGPKGDPGNQGIPGTPGEDGRTPYTHWAYAWSADGTDRFTPVYPRENLLLGTLPNNWPTLGSRRSMGSAVATLDDEKVLVTASSATPYYIAGGFSDKQILSDEFIAKIKGKRLVASVDVAFVNQLTVPTNNLGISIYYWREGGSIFTPSNRKTIAGNERIWIDALIPEDAVNVLVAIRGYEGFVNGASFEFDNLKLEIVDAVPTSATIYTPSPSEDYTNAYPLYQGTYTDFNETASTDPSKYTWQRVMGESGQDGKDGDPGQNAQEVFSGYLSNEAIILSANASGAVSDFSKANGNFVTYLGQNQLTSGVTYSLVSQTGITSAINATTGAYSVSAASADSGMAIFKAVYQGVTIQKIVSVTKAKQGSTGSTGPKGDTGLTGSQGPKGAQGDPTGVTESATVPANPYVGMLWKNTGTAAGYLKNTVYRWNGSKWDIWTFSAVNIIAETFSGITFSGVTMEASEFKSQFSYYDPGTQTQYTGQQSLSGGHYVTSYTDNASGGGFEMTPNGELTSNYKNGNIENGYDLTYNSLSFRNNGVTGYVDANTLMMFNNVGKKLWSGEWFVSASQTITPNVKMSDCLNGWVLEWRGYTNGASIDGDYNYTYVPKVHGQAHSGSIMSAWVVGYGGSSFRKILYVTDSNLKGHSNNAAAPANSSVLTAVYAF